MAFTWEGGHGGYWWVAVVARGGLLYHTHIHRHRASCVGGWWIFVAAAFLFPPIRTIS